jgi:hypothetical protein
MDSGRILVGIRYGRWRIAGREAVLDSPVKAFFVVLLVLVRLPIFWFFRFRFWPLMVTACLPF